MDNQPIGITDGWVATPLTKEAARRMNVPACVDDFYSQKIAPIEMNALERSNLSEKMLNKTKVFLDISETEQALLKARYVSAFIDVINDEMNGASQILRVALEKVLDVLCYALKNKADVIFWF